MNSYPRKERHIKGKRIETWTDTRIEIQSIVKLLGITAARFTEVDMHLWSDIENKILKAYSKAPNYALPNFGYPFQFMDKLVNNHEKVWFMMDETVREKQKFWMYEGFISEIQKVIEESYRVDEIIVASQKYEWVLMIDHHDIITGTGEMIDKLKLIEKGIKLQ